jgi:hypothetical protein
MGKIWVKELTGGLDVRRLPETTPGGVLSKGQDGHITSGGEFEKRAAFVKAYTLPTGTVGLAADTTSLIVFGSATDPGVPSGVAYQRLQKGVKSLADVPSWDLYQTDVYAVGEFTDGTIVHYFDTAEVTDWFDGRARASFLVTGGTDATSTLDLLVNGVSIMAAAVTYDTDPVTTATAIAAAINSHTSTPDYSATSSGTQVNIIAATAGAASNGLSVTFLPVSGFTTSPDSGLSLANGADSTAFVPGTFVKTLGRKMMALSGSVWHLSGLDEPTHWTTDFTGAAFFDQAKEDSRAQTLQAIANYQGLVALIAKKVVLIWFVDPDPDLITKRQVLSNTGTVSPRSVTEFGDADVFYQALSGLRSMRARDQTNNATTTDLGSPIDSLIRAKLSALSETERAGVIGLMNPIDDRFWLCFPDGTIFVFSFFPNAKVSAWTTYIFTDDDGNQATIDKVAIFGERLYIRTGDEIYVYGGLDTGAGLTYDSTVAKAWLPYFDAGKPTEAKEWQGLDAAVSGTWTVYAAMQPTATDVRDQIDTITETTFNGPRHPFQGYCTHVSPQFESMGSGEAKLSSVVLHYKDGEDS